MNFKGTWLVVVFLAAASDGHLLSPLICYYCEDCASSTPIIQPCGFTNPILTTPSTVGDNPQYPPQNPPYSSEPILTPPAVVGGGESGTIYPQYPDYIQGNPILTQPTIPPATVTPAWNDGPVSGANNGGGILTTIWPGTTSKQGEKPAKIERYICAMAKYTVGKRQVVSRGCTRQGRSNDETCNGISKGKYQQCTLCSSPLCNNGRLST